MRHLFASSTLSPFRRCQSSHITAWYLSVQGFRSQQQRNHTHWMVTALSATLLSAPMLINHDWEKNKSCWSLHMWSHRLLGYGSSVSCTPNLQKTEEIDIGPVDQFDKGELYEVKIHGGKDQILIANVNGQLYCTGNSCSHYSAPLHRGILSKTKTVQCPWHDAEFDLSTGKCTGGCGLKSIPSYPLEIRNARVYITVPIEGHVEDSIDAPMAKRDPQNKEVIGIVGAGAAALTAAETLRQEGYTGRILMLGQEPHTPYDRPVLSKNLNAKIDKLLLRKPEWLTEKATVEFRPNTVVKNVDLKKKMITTGNGETIKCDKILIATGGLPRRLAVPGSDLKNIETLRSFEDMQRLAPYGKLDKNVVIIGSSFIGMELAATMAKAGAKVTIVGMEKAPFQRVLGERIGRQLLWVVNQKGATFRGESTVVKFHGSGGKVTGVELNNRDVLQADLVILGVGVIPNTDMVEGIDKLKDKSIKVDPFMQITGCKDVYAAGDIATFPYYKTGEDIRVEHWDVAMQQGRIAAKHMMGQMVPYDSIPFFWTMIMGKSIRYAGYCIDPDEIIIEGNIEEMSFAALYIKNDQIQAVATCGKDPAAVAAVEAMRRNLLPPYLEYQMGLFNTDEIIRLAKKNVGKEY